MSLKSCNFPKYGFRIDIEIVASSKQDSIPLWGEAVSLGLAGHFGNSVLRMGRGPRGYKPNGRGGLN